MHCRQVSSITTAEFKIFVFSQKKEEKKNSFGMLNTYTHPSLLPGTTTNPHICRELSRCHCKIEYIPEYECFCLSDAGSRNGTYMQLNGLYGSERELCLGSHILVGRTGFRIDRFAVGKSERKGKRQVMEDRSIVVPTLGVPGLTGPILTPQSFYGVYDGHGGDECSDFLQSRLHIEFRKSLAAKAARLSFAVENMLSGELFSTEEENTMDTRIGLFDLYMKQAFMAAFCETDEEFLKTAHRPESGSTATTALILGNRIYSANVGDSRTILSRGGKLVMASYDHTPQREDEEARIKHAGGFIAGSRVMGELAVSRSFGDMQFKRQVHSKNCTWDVKLVTCTPEFQAVPLTPDDDFIVLACDGLFDVFSNQEVLDAVREQMDKHGSTELACAEITKQAIEQRGTRDNVSMLLVLLKPWKRKEE